jgi:hypothetical protein
MPYLLMISPFFFFRLIGGICQLKRKMVSLILLIVQMQF